MFNRLIPFSIWSGIFIYKSKYEKVGVLPIWIVKSNVSSVGLAGPRRPRALDFTIRICSSPTVSYFDLHLYSAYSTLRYIYIWTAISWLPYLMFQAYFMTSKMFQFCSNDSIVWAEVYVVLKTWKCLWRCLQNEDRVEITLMGLQIFHPFCFAWRFSLFWRPRRRASSFRVVDLKVSLNVAYFATGLGSVS